VIESVRWVRKGEDQEKRGVGRVDGGWWLEGSGGIGWLWIGGRKGQFGGSGNVGGRCRRLLKGTDLHTSENQEGRQAGGYRM
jgi:hypothetical protein